MCTGQGACARARDEVPVLATAGAVEVAARVAETHPDLRLEIEQLLTDGPAAAAEGVMTGTHDGVFHTPNGDVAPTGRAIALRWAAVYVTAGDTLAVIKGG